ncbi:hypothetical protein LUZ60_008340 [Juncus effusus]|nr:hypothetical protein LUZ60_008340 [Juncus effusus]
MTFPPFMKQWGFLLALLCLSFHLCESDPLDVIGEAEQCFDDGRLYTCCDDPYRLGIQGILNVPHQAANEFCNGPCLAETQLVLSCVEDELNTFKFQNGAYVSDVRYALQRGCTVGARRGDFNVGEPHEPDDYNYNDYYGHASKLDTPFHFLFLLIFTLVF